MLLKTACLLLTIKIITSQDIDGVRTVKLCDLCTCSEIFNMEKTHLILNIHCSDTDRVMHVTDLEKIEWPENPNGLKISATFEGVKFPSLAKLPPNSQLESLRFTNNEIKTYWYGPFADVPNLKKLSIAQNDLMEITPDLFTNIESLEEFDASYNKLTSFNPLDFVKLRHLKRLNLQGNMFNKIPFEALKPIMMLEELDMGKNNIFDLMLPENQALSGLKRLSLNGNKIRSIFKNSFPANNSIEFIDLSNNIVEIVEESSFMTCTNLNELDVSQNNITFVFSLPTSLQIAKLRGNTLYHWPKFPSGIKYIDLSYNRLSQLYDEATVNFDNLEVLYVGGNQIAEVNINNKLQNLYFLDLSYNIITEVPKTLNSQLLPNLSDLRLDGNPIETIYFKNILAVSRLYMTELKSLVVVDEKAFSNVVGQAVGEPLGQIPCFSLYLTNCPSLSEIKVGAFDGTSLCMLDISKNNLTHISSNLTDWSTAVDGVNLQHNPWHCTCDMQWVIQELIPRMYKSNNTGFLDELKCYTPLLLRGRRFVHWYNWSGDVLCSTGYQRSETNFPLTMLSSEQSESSKWLIRILEIVGCCIIVVLVVAIVAVCLVKRKRTARAKRRRQEKTDNNNGLTEQIKTLNRS